MLYYPINTTYTNGCAISVIILYVECYIIYHMLYHI